MNLIRMTIFHFETIIENATNSLYDDWNAGPYQRNDAYLARNGGYKAPSTVAKTVAFVFNEGNEEYEELIAPYIREENVYFDLDSAKEALKREK